MCHSFIVTRFSHSSAYVWDSHAKALTAFSVTDIIHLITNFLQVNNPQFEQS